MNQRLLIALIILAGIGSITAVSAYSGSVSAVQGNFNNVLVTGSCTGCGGSEADYTTYSLVRNSTITGSSGFDGALIIIANDKSFVGQDLSNRNMMVKSDGTTNKIGVIDVGIRFPTVASSESGKYKAILATNNGTIYIYKDDSLIQNISIDTTHSFFDNLVAIGFSPNGKYIGILGDDQSNTIDRIQIWQGS